MRRRTFLETSISVAASGSLLSCARRGGSGQWRFFTAAEARIAEAVCEQLIPADQDPGAKQAGVVNYIDIQLTRAFRKHRAAYRQGLAAVDAASRAKFGQPFPELTLDRQREVLLAAEKDSRPFFDLILNHTRQGFYGDPRHGGNRGMASWKMIGLPFPPVRGRQHYQTPKQG